MSEFTNYLLLGYEHIMNLEALDHLLFLIALVAIYQIRYWLRIVIAVTFFTVGHSITLALGAFEVVEFDKNWIEFLIPVTILATSLLNLSKGGQQPNARFRYWVALFFGLIHGLGFSNYYQILVMGDKNGWEALLPFNLGVELGLLAAAGILFILMFIYQIIMNKKVREWNIFFSGVAFGLSLIMCLETWPGWG